MLLCREVSPFDPLRAWWGGSPSCPRTKEQNPQRAFFNGLSGGGRFALLIADALLGHCVVGRLRQHVAGAGRPADAGCGWQGCRAYEGETAQRIASALARRAEQRAALPRLLAARLAGGAFTARGILPRDPLQPVDIPALAWGAAEIALGWEEATLRSGSKPYSTHSSPPAAPGSVTLPGGITLRGVRVYAAEPRVAPLVEEPPMVPEMPAAPEDSTSLVSGRSGFAGRPNSRHLVGLEHARRLAAGEAKEKITHEAEYLSAWLATTHPDWPQATPKAIANNIGATHRRGLQSRPK